MSEVVALSRFTAALARPRGKKRLDAILEKPHPELEIRAMDGQDLYTLVKEVGLETAVEFLSFTSGEQIQCCLDLDAWQGSSIVRKNLDAWFTVLLDQGPQDFVAHWEALDPELTALYLCKEIRIFDLSEEEVPEDLEAPLINTPDNAFVVCVFPNEDGSTNENLYRLITKLLDSLYRVDQQIARHTLRQARTEPEAYLEEESYRFRCARLEDLGFCPPEEARAIYQPVDLNLIRNTEGQLQAGLPHATVPAIYAEASYGVGFLGRVLAKVQDAKTAERLEAGLLLLFNKALVSDSIDPADFEGIQRSVARAAGTLSIGLETLTQADEEAALNVLCNLPLQDLHRAGYTVLGKLTTLLTSLGAAGKFCDEPYAQVVTGLKQKPHPLFANVLSDSAQADFRAFEKLSDVSTTTAALARLGNQVQFVCQEHSLPQATFSPEVSIGDVGRTLLVHLAIGAKEIATPVSTASLQAFRQTAFANDKLSEQSRAAILAKLSAAFQATATGWLADIEEVLGGVSADKFDARFVSAFWTMAD